MTPRSMKWRRDGTSPAPKPIDIYLDGLGKDGRLQVSSGTTFRDAYTNRVNAIREAWAMGGVWRDGVRAVHAKGVTVDQFYTARQGGVDALEKLLRDSGAELLAPAIREFLKQAKARHKAQIKQKLERFVVYLVAELKRPPTLADVTTATIDSFLAQLIDERTAKTTQAPAKGSTVNRYRAALSGFCTWAVKHGRMHQHPIAGKRVAKREEPHHRLPEMTAEEYAGYTGAVRAMRPDLLILSLLLLHTAVDVGELLDVPTRDLDLDRRRIRYHRPKVPTSRPRFVPIPALVVAALRAHVTEHGVKGNDALFGMFDRRDLEWVHRRAARAINRPELTLKDLRHIAAIAWTKAGVHIRLVMRWLGHKSLTLTMRYTDYEPEADMAAVMAERAAETLAVIP